MIDHGAWTKNGISNVAAVGMYPGPTHGIICRDPRPYGSDAQGRVRYVFVERRRKAGYESGVLVHQVDLFS